MKMNELSKKSGLSPSTIRYYISEKMIAEPKRPTKNSAIYQDKHLQSLKLIKQIREISGALPLTSIKRIIQLVNRGIELEVAIVLHQEISGQLGGMVDLSNGLNLMELVKTTGVTKSFVMMLIDQGIMVPEPGEKQSFNEADIKLIETVNFVLKMIPDAMDYLSQISSYLKQASALEMELRNISTKTVDDETAAKISQKFQKLGNFFHAYLFSRFRQEEISKFQLGNSQHQQRHTHE